MFSFLNTTTGKRREYSEAKIFNADGYTVSYTLVRSNRRSRTIGFRFSIRHGLIIRAPLRTPQYQVDTAIISKLKWLQRSQRALQQSAAISKQYLAGETVCFLGENYTLGISIGKKSFCERTGTSILVSLSSRTPQTSNSVRKVLRTWYRMQAKDILVQRARLYTKQMGLPHVRVCVKEQKKSWGTTNCRDIIRLNWKLIMIPAELIDLVIVHELSHVFEPNHSQAFWKVVASIVPDYRERRKELRSMAHVLNF